MLVLVCLIAYVPAAFAQIETICENYGGPYPCTDPDRDLPEGNFVGWRVESINDGKHCQVVDDNWKPVHNGVRTFIAVTRHDHPSCPGGYVPFPTYVLGPNSIAVNNCVSWPGNQSLDNSNFYVNDCGYFPALMARDIKCSTGHLWYGLEAKAVCFHPGLQLGKHPRCEADGNPIVRAIGVKTETQEDLTGPIKWQRTYDSVGNNAMQTARPGSAGVGWNTPFQQRIEVQNFSSSTVKVRRTDGRWYIARLAGGLWTLDADIADRLTEVKNSSGQRTGWTYYEAASESVEQYDATGLLQSISLRPGTVQLLAYNASGRLQTVTDSFGNMLTFAYFPAGAATKAGLLQSVTDRAGNQVSYTYDIAGNLTSAMLPAETSKQYLYGESALTQGAYLPYALTGLSDEHGVRFASFGYDGQGRAIATEHAGGVQRYQLNFAPDEKTIVTDPLGTVRTYSFQTILGVAKATNVDQPCPSCGGTQSQATTYDANGNVASRTDFNNKKTCYAYDMARNLETSRVEGLLSNEDCAASLTTPPNRPDVKKTVTTWHATYRLPLSITEPAAAATVGGAAGTKLTEFTYDAAGNMLTRKVTAPRNDGSGTNEIRTWTYTYNSLGQVLTVKDPLNRTTTTVYYAATDTANPPRWTKRDVQTITNDAGHVTTFSEYDRNGRLLKMTDANGLVTTMTYHPRG